jgi:DNA invertase Pin-like site-specific DNA recombinase
MPRHTVNPQTAIAYIRVSKEREGQLGPEAQRSAIEAWASAQGVTIAAWHDDIDVSGGDELGERVGLVQALGDVKLHHAGLLVIAKRDRLARDVYVAATIERAVQSAGARVVSADGTANGDTPADAFMRTILDAAAAYERAMIRARTKAALAAKSARGERAGNIGFGYRLADPSDPDSDRIEENPEEQAIIAAVHDLRTRGATYRAIVATLREMGMKSRAGTPLQIPQVARILSRAA